MNTYIYQLEQFLLSFHNIQRPSCQILYATKYLGAKEMASFLHVLHDRHIPMLIGENRVQDAEKKFSFLHDHHPDLFSRVIPIMIGRLQRNKVRKAVEIFSCIQSVHSRDLAKEIDSESKEQEKKMDIYLQVNVSEEFSKQGISIPDVPVIISEVRQMDHLRLVGLMTMAPYRQDPEETRPIFHTLRSLADQYGLKTSMGMSNDWKIAVEEGSDMIRVGSHIFQSADIADASERG